MIRGRTSYGKTQTCARRSRLLGVLFLVRFVFEVVQAFASSVAIVLEAAGCIAGCVLSAAEAGQSFVATLALDEIKVAVGFGAHAGELPCRS